MFEQYMQKLFTKNILTARQLLECYLKRLIVIQFSKCPAMKSPSILEKFNVKLLKNAIKRQVLLCFQLTQNVLFN